jgi:ketosteroid isomerase-like protein
MIDTYCLYVWYCKEDPVNPTGAAAAEASSPSEDLAADWVARFAEGWRAPDGPDSFVAHFRELLAPDVRLIQPQVRTTVGHQAFDEEFVRPLFALMPDLHGEVERWAARRDSLYIELTLSGTLAGRAVSWRACDRITLRDGMAVERESYFDPAPLLLALARTPRVWPRFLRLRVAPLINRIRWRNRP